MPLIRPFGTPSPLGGKAEQRVGRQSPPFSPLTGVTSFRPALWRGDMTLLYGGTLALGTNPQHFPPLTGIALSPYSARLTGFTLTFPHSTSA